MSNYFPDKWLIVKLTTNDKSHYRVFASWYGGYGGSDSWQLNSGITNVVDTDGCYHFIGSSGSIYICNKSTYGISSYANGVLRRLISNALEQNTIIEILPNETNILELNYE